ncbi:hypothetical protein L484_019604 [Morus notabilis]|uniref:Protein ARV n=1 Tax=Morus notabilis TaxID=981085 RepID=W9S6L8_9ROSA|nr:hypothetical protein L484_019604 [Morus notabilis]
MKYRCVECGYGTNSLFVQYSPGNIRLMKCENCKAVADEYIECEIMIIVIDLIVNKPKAYRHLLYNVLGSQTLNFKVLMDVVIGNLMFFATFLLAMRIFLSTSIGSLRYKDIFLAILVSSYFKMCLFAMMVWEFPSSVVFIIDLYVLSSNIVALKVITESAMSRCVLTCFSAHLMKFLVTQALELRTL